MNAPIPMLGRKFGQLTVVARAPTPPGGNQPHWHCLCDCGKQSIAQGYALRAGHTKTCGCGRTGRPQTAFNSNETQTAAPNTTRDWLTPWRIRNESLIHDGR